MHSWGQSPNSGFQNLLDSHLQLWFYPHVWALVLSFNAMMKAADTGLIPLLIT